MYLEWSVFALADREAIFDYIEADSPRAAVCVDDRIEARVEGLAQFPEMGRPGRIEGTRELVISRTPILPHTALLAIRCESSGYCMAHSSGRTRWLKNQKSIPGKL